MLTKESLYWRAPGLFLKVVYVYNSTMQCHAVVMDTTGTNIRTHVSNPDTSPSFFCHPIYYLRPSISLLVVNQIRGHVAGSSPPLPTTVRALHFYREKVSALSSLADSRLIVLTHARRSQQLILFYFNLANKFKISPRRDSNSRANTSRIRGLPL